MSSICWPLCASGWSITISKDVCVEWRLGLFELFSAEWKANMYTTYKVCYYLSLRWGIKGYRIYHCNLLKKMRAFYLLLAIGFIVKNCCRWKGKKRLGTLDTSWPYQLRWRRLRAVAFSRSVMFSFRTTTPMWALCIPPKFKTSSRPQAFPPKQDYSFPGGCAFSAIQNNISLSSSE